MRDELNRVTRLRRLLEPLAVMYERHILHPGVNPQEFLLACPMGSHSETITGMELKAVHECWRDFRGLEKHLQQVMTQGIISEASVKADPGSIFERTHTGTWRGRLKDLLKK